MKIREIELYLRVFYRAVWSWKKTRTNKYISINQFHEIPKFQHVLYLHFEQVRLAYLIQMATVPFDSQHWEVQKFYFEFLVADQQQLLGCLKLKVH